MPRLNELNVIDEASFIVQLTKDDFLWKTDRLGVQFVSVLYNV